MRNPLTLIAAIAAFVITFSFLSEAGGATYYVDASGGSDGNNGLTTGAAWQTVAQVNSQTFSAGDTILFKRGEVWDDRLNITDSQTTWGAYGTGARPEIDASGDNYAIRVYGATTVTLQSLYATSGAYNAFLIEDGDGSHLIDCMGAYAAREGFMINSSPNVIIEACLATSNSVSGIQFWGGSSGGLVRDSIAWGNGQEGLNFEDGASNARIYRTVCFENGKAGFDIADEGAQTGDITYYDCVSYGNGTSVASSGNGFTTFQGRGGVSYYNCLAFDNLAHGWEFQSNSVTTDGAIVENCTSIGNAYRGLQISDSNVTVTNTIMMDSGWTEQIKVNSGLTGITLDYNCYYRTGGGAIKMNWEGTAHTGLSAWQTASGQDANSIESNPQLDDYRDRYIPEIGSPVLGAGEGGGNIGWRGTHHSRYGGRGGFK